MLKYFNRYTLIAAITTLSMSFFMLPIQNQKKIIVAKPKPISIPLEMELKCLADNIYHEARNESIKGQVAVALVTINRVNSQYYPNTICEVVWEYKQFSWTLDKVLAKTKYNKRAYDKAELIALVFITKTMANEEIRDFTNNSTHYHANYVSPYWASNLKYIMKIDNHIFYKFKK